MEKILLVEDEARIRNIVLDYFTAHGLSCDLARNGEEALDILRDNDCDFAGYSHAGFGWICRLSVCAKEEQCSNPVSYRTG